MQRLFLSIIIFSLLGPQAIMAQNNDYLILISWDGCRWDYINRNLTPNVQKLIDDGVRAESLQPAYPSKTFPNHYTLVTGLYPQNHGIVFNKFQDFITGDSYRIGKDAPSIHRDKWYKGESLWITAQKHGIKSGVVFWPGSETFKKHPDYFLTYNHTMPHKEKLDRLMEWINLPQTERPHLLLLYFPDTDDAGHDFGPDSEEVNEIIKKLDTTLGGLIERLKKSGIYEKTNIVLVSDHGMINTDIDKGINIREMLSGFHFKVNGDSPNLTFFSDNIEIDKMYKVLKNNENGFNTYLKDEIPEHLHIRKSLFIGQLLVMAKPGYYFKSPWPESKGSHGFDPKIKNVHGVFVAHGPALKKAFATETIQNIDVYPLLCSVLGIQPGKNIDGSLNRVKALLK
jgi:predicted AlkP superfamily pyrophosphatase or phosphodiesterase